MKNRTNKVLLTLFFLTSAAYGVIFLTYIQYGGNATPAPLGVYMLRLLHFWLVLGGHAIPFFCLQLLLCRFRCWRVSRPFLSPWYLGSRCCPAAAG